MTLKLQKNPISSDNFFLLLFINYFKDYVMFIFLATFLTRSTINNNLLPSPNISENSKMSFMMYHTQKIQIYFV